MNLKEIDRKKMVKLLKEIDYRRGCRLAAQDKVRDQEIALWDTIE